MTGALKNEKEENVKTEEEKQVKKKAKTAVLRRRCLGSAHDDC